MRRCLRKERRLSLGESGVSAKKDFWGGPMCNDGGTGFNCSAADGTLRVGGVTNPDGSASFAVVNWGGDRWGNLGGIEQTKGTVQ